MLEQSMPHPPAPEPIRQVRPVDIGDQALDFSFDSQLGMISFHDYIDGKWAFLLTFSKAFDPVALTDIGHVCKLIEEFKARNIATICLGGDSVSNYRRWIRDIEELQEVRVLIINIIINNLY